MCVAYFAFHFSSLCVTARHIEALKSLRVQSAVFDVKNYGGKADGKSDISKALLGAWKEACSAKGSNIVVAKTLLSIASITAPGDSVNTDGISHRAFKRDQHYNSNIANGDDCISIGGASEQNKDHKRTMWTGHGISVGSLGRPLMNCLRNFRKELHLYDTDNGGEN
ncbi:polygalacturonase ADPG2-like [Manihot esculenta]|uniref:polygalacturonase ADPG2-like n=1 Tax=Manihot esculenta TaxID=3983 RepID=UPI001CC74C00|nr:polygalacturonase ADPG2-like [Manihot esculenta]